MKFNCLIFFLFLNLISFAQLDERNAITTSIGITGHGKEKVNAPTLLLTYQKDFYPKTMIELYGAWAASVDISTEEEMQELQSFRFGMNFLFKILEERDQSFKAGIGFSSGLYDTDGITIATQEDISSVDFQPGFSVLVEYHYILPSQWLFGARTSLHRYDTDRRGWFVGGVLGYRF